MDVRICPELLDFQDFLRISVERLVVDRAGFEPAYALAGRFTVCCH